MQTASHGIFFLLRCLWHVSHIYSFLSNNFTGWYNSGASILYFSCLLIWHDVDTGFDDVFCKCNRNLFYQYFLSTSAFSGYLLFCYSILISGVFLALPLNIFLHLRIFLISLFFLIVYFDFRFFFVALPFKISLLLSIFMVHHFLIVYYNFRIFFWANIFDMAFAFMIYFTLFICDTLLSDT